MKKTFINKTKNYIPSLNLNDIELLKDLRENYLPIRRILINTIKVDKTKFAFNNEIYQGTIDNIINNFNIDFWDPILVSEDNYLLDGQHRLRACHILGIKFIDALIEKGR